jgi:DNA-binding Xre family transcriptional regulator/predicted XRE-type DNA-binding protein
MKIKIAELAGKHGLKSAYALQKALDISPTMASRLWKGEFDKIGINTLEKLCDYFQCQPNDLLEYPLTLSGNTESSKNVERATQLSNTELSKPQSAPVSNVESVRRRLKENAPVVASNPADVSKRLKEASGEVWKNSVLDIVQSSSDNETLLSSVQVAERLGVSRKSVNDYIIDGKLKATKGKQNHNFVSEADLQEFIKKSQLER